MIWIIWLFIIVLDALLNAWLEHHWGINHTINSIYRAVIAGLLIWGFQLGIAQAICFVFAAGFWFWLAFNPLLNFLRTPRKPFFYVGNGRDGSKLDIIEFKYQVPIIFLKLLMAPSLTYFYYYFG